MHCKITRAHGLLTYLKNVSQRVAPLSPNIRHRKSLRERIVCIENIIRKTGDPSSPTDRGHHRFVRTELHLFHKPSSKTSSQYAFVNKVLMQRQLSLLVQNCHFRGRSGAARGPVQYSSPGIWL